MNIRKEDFNNVEIVNETIEYLYQSFRDGDYEVGHKNLELSLSLADAALKFREFESYYRIAKVIFKIYQINGDLDVARNFVDIAINATSEEYLSAQKYSLFIMLGMTYYENGNFVECFRCFQMFKNYAVKVNDVEAIAKSNVNMGDILMNVGDFHRAIEYFISVIDMVGPNSDDNRVRDHYLLSVINICEAVVRDESSNVKDYEEYFDLMNTYEDQYNVAYHAHMYFLTAKYYEQNGELDKVDELYLKSLDEYYHVQSERYYFYIVLYDYCLHMVSNNRYQEAYDLLSKYEIEDEERVFVTISAKLHQLFADVCVELGKKDEAIEQYKKGFKFRFDKEEMKSKRNQIELLIDKNEAELRINDLKRDVINDVLTGLFNRRPLQKDLHKALDRLEKTSELSKICLMYIDIDDFKNINDSLGHAAGDRFLRAIGHILKDFAAKYEGKAYRVGGDEFFILFTFEYDISSETIGDEIRKAIETISFRGYDKAGRSTASIGVLDVFTVKDGEPDEYIVKVDQLMYKAKDSTKNTTKYDSIK